MKLIVDDFHDDAIVEVKGVPFVSLQVANWILENQLKEATIVYGRPFGSANHKNMSWSEQKYSTDTTTARLIDIQEIKAR